MCNEPGRLYKGCKKNVRTDTITFILHRDKLKDRRATYARAVCDIRPQKIETNITRLTAGVNIIDYPGEVITPISDLNTMNLHVNSAISDIKLKNYGSKIQANRLVYQRADLKPKIGQ